MKVSVVVPAFNEEKLLGGCVDAVRAAFAGQAAPADYEIVVCDNNSTDGTAAAAALKGVRTVFEPLNQISLARNTGAAAAGGEWLLFVDADSRLSAGTLGEALALMRGAACGGGALIALDAPIPLWGRALAGLWNLVSRVLGLASGSFLFCRAEAFRAVGGFSPVLYAAEEIALSRALKRWGAARGQGFRIITAHPHLSSGRKFRVYGFGDLLLQGFRFLLSPRRSVKDPARLRVFYEGRR